MPGETADVHLVNDGARSRPLEGSVTLPIVQTGVYHDVLHRGPAVVTLTSRGLAAIVLGNYDTPSIWVQQDLGGIKAHAGAGIKAALHPIPVKLAWFQIRHKYMPVIVGAIGRPIDCDHACRARIIFAVEEQQLDARGAPRKNTEVDALRNNSSAERRAAPAANVAVSDKSSLLRNNGAHDLRPLPCRFIGQRPA